ncbi:hypothetical protein RI367_002366 [Sorochytrium milnesiophthora]
MNVKGKVAIVTGGASGFGEALVAVLLSKGAYVVIADIDDACGKVIADGANKGSSEKRAVFVKCDVANSADCRAVFDVAKQTFGHVDIVANNAGIGQFRQLADDKEQFWKKTLAVNLTAVIEGTQLAIEYMQGNPEGGVVVNTASLAGYYPLGISSVYAATKHGVVGFTTSLKDCEKLYNVRVTAVAPGFADTALVRRGMDNNPEFAKRMQQTTMIPVATVVEAMMQCIEDKTISGQVLQVWADQGIVRVDPPQVRVLERPSA